MPVLFYTKYLFHPAPSFNIFLLVASSVLAPCFPQSPPSFLFASLLPSSLCPPVRVRPGSVGGFLCKPQVQTTPCEGISATVSAAPQKPGDVHAHICVPTHSYLCTPQIRGCFWWHAGDCVERLSAGWKETSGKMMDVQFCSLKCICAYSE